MNLDKLRRRHAAKLDVPEDRVELVQLDLDILNQMGTFVRIYAGGLTIFSCRATWKELGVPQKSSRRVRYRRPPRLLVPQAIPKRFRSLASQARAALEAHGVEVDFMHPYRWVGYKGWDEFLDDLRRIEQEWLEYRRREVLDRYDLLVRRLAEDFEDSALEALEALEKAGEPDLPSRDEFVANVVSSALSRMPTPERIERKLILTYYTPAVVEPAGIEQMLTEREKVRQDRQHQLELQALEQEAQTDARLAEMRRQRLEHLREQTEMMSEPLEQVLTQLRREVEETARRSLEVIGEHGGLRGRSGEGLRKLSQRVQMLDRLGDGALLGLVQEAAGLTQGGDEETDDQADARGAALAATLRQIESLVAAGQEARRSAALVAQEVPQRRWRSICLACRHVWASEGSVEPVTCPACESAKIASREENGMR